MNENLVTMERDELTSIIGGSLPPSKEQQAASSYLGAPIAKPKPTYLQGIAPDPVVMDPGLC